MSNIHYKKYKAAVMSHNKTVANVIIDGALMDNILDEQPNVPITINFNGVPVGYSESFEWDPDKKMLICHAQISIDNLDTLDVYLVSKQRIVDTDMKLEHDGSQRIMKAELIELAITSHPADKSLTKLEREP